MVFLKIFICYFLCFGIILATLPLATGYNAGRYIIDTDNIMFFSIKWISIGTLIVFILNSFDLHRDKLTSIEIVELTNKYIHWSLAGFIASFIYTVVSYCLFFKASGFFNLSLIIHLSYFIGFYAIKKLFT